MTKIQEKLAEAKSHVDQFRNQSHLSAEQRAVVALFEAATINDPIPEPETEEKAKAKK